MNVLFVNSTRKWGGVKTWTLDMAGALVRRGHSAMILGRPGPFIDKALALGLPARAVRFGPDANPLLLARLLTLMTRRRIDRVVVNVSKDLRSAGLAAALLGIPVCHRVGAVGDLRESWKDSLAHRLVRPRLLTCSDYVRRGLLEKLSWLTPEEIGYLHPGKRPRPDAPPAPRSPLRLVSTSQLNADKLHDETLEALASLRGEHDFRMTFVGTGKVEAELKRRCSEFGLDDIVTWAGFSTDVEAHLRQADAFLLPTRVEPLGQSLQEAMAMGLIPVARGEGGVPEIVPPSLGHLLYRGVEGAAGLTRVLRGVLGAEREALVAWKHLAWRHAAAAFEIERQADRFVSWLLELDTRRP